MNRLPNGREHIPRILQGSKHKTARYGLDPEDFQKGNRLTLEDYSGSVFATVVISDVYTVTAREFALTDHEGHRNYESVDELIERLGRYYPDADLGPETELVVIEWRGVQPTLE